jgi:glycosyltransferase involved in cell wall biosynthesis
MMTIGIDANEANVTSRVGISEYAFQILTKLYEFRKDGITNHTFVIYLKSKPLGFLPQENEWWKYKVVSPKKMWTQFALPLNLFISKPRPDVFLTLTHYAPRVSPIPTVISVMDVSFLRFPETFKQNDLYQLKKWTEYSVKKAKKIITISQSSKNDIIKYYKVPAEKIKVVHLGLKEVLSIKNEVLSMEDLAGKFNIKNNYILFVGTLQPRKNIARLIEAYSLLPGKIKEEYQLVIIGKKGWLYEDILKAPEKYKVSERVLFLDYVSDEDLPQFYKNAKVFVLPSLYEGFGLPVLEAMRYDCPVVTSNVSSLPEAGGDAALYFDPTDVGDIKNKIETVLTDDKLREKMIEKGKIHYKKFTWEKAAREVLDTIEEVGEKQKTMSNEQ